MLRPQIDMVREHLRKRKVHIGRRETCPLSIPYQ